MGLLLQTCVKKTVHRIETYWLSNKEKVPGAAVCKLLTVFIIDFLEKSVTLNSGCYCQLI